MINPFESSDAKFAADMLAEARHSREKCLTKPIATALVICVGDLALALLDIKADLGNDWHAVHDAAVAVAAMVLRIAAEGDPVLGAVPTKENCK